MANRWRLIRLDGGGVSLGYTGYMLFRECPMKFYLEYIAGGSGLKRPESGGQVDPELLYGKLWHSLYEARLTNGNLFKAFEEGLAENQLSPADFPEYFRSLVDDLDWYFEQEKDRRIEILSIEEELKLEVKSERTGLTHVLRGTPDLVGRDEAAWGGGIGIFDHKTYKVITKDNRLYLDPNDLSILRYKHARQFPCYAALWNQLKPDLKITDGLINLVPQQARRVLEIQRSRKGNQRELTITREPIVSNEDAINRALAAWVNACDVIAGMLIDGAGMDDWQRMENPNACVGKWRPCSWLEFCEAPKALREDMAQSYYEPK